MPEANADGSATDKFLENFAANPQPVAPAPAPAVPVAQAQAPAGQTTNVPIHLKITSENGQIQGVEQVSNTNYQAAAEEQTVKLPPIEVPKPEQGQENTIRIRLNQKEQQQANKQ